MANEEFYDDNELVFYLTIDGTSYEEVEVKVSDPCKLIREHVITIVSLFELPKIDNGSNLIKYFLGRENDDEIEILDFEDEDGRELCLLDYNVQTGDHLHLGSISYPGCLPIKVQVTGYVSEARGCIFKIDINGRPRSEYVAEFIKYIVETFHLPIFYNGCYIDYSLNIWDGNKNIKCNISEQLWHYVRILLNNDSTPYGDSDFSLNMVLTAEQSMHRSYLGPLFERLHRYCGHILYKYKLQI